MIVAFTEEYKPGSPCHVIAERKGPSGRIVRKVRLSEIAARTSITFLKEVRGEWKACFFKKADLHMLISICTHAIDEPTSSWEWGYDDHHDHRGERFGAKVVSGGVRFSWGYSGMFSGKRESCTITVPASHIPQLRESLRSMREHDRYPDYSTESLVTAGLVAAQGSRKLAETLATPRAVTA